MKYQSRHHGIEIPQESQPKCNHCGGGMSLNIAYPNDECVSFWYCLENECDAPRFEQISFQEWLESFPVSEEIRKHFATVGTPASESIAQGLLSEGYKLVGGHTWGGGFWGEAKGKKAWTGHKGQSMEYWSR